MLAITLLVALSEITFSRGELPVLTNSSNFSLIVETATYVDKTLFIKEFMESRDMIVFTAPPGFGKSTNLNMIKTFCDVIVDEDGNRVEYFTENYKLFLKNNLNIYKYHGDFFSNHFGVNPVIYFDFKQLNCVSYHTFIVSFRRMILNVFVQYSYLLRSERLDKLEKDHIEKFNKEVNVKEMVPIELYDSVKELTRLLYVHFMRTECIILVDDYDKPVQQAILESGKDIGLIMIAIHEFTLATIKYNIYVARGIITACIGLEGITSTEEFFDVKHIPILEDRKFSKYFGFTEEEVATLLTRHNLTDTRNKVKEWYYGYNGIYSPYEVVSYLAHKTIDDYWVKSANMKNLGKLFTGEVIRRNIEQLLKDGFLEIPLVEPIFIINVVKLKEIMNNQEPWYLNSLRSEDVNLMMKFMIDQGYFHVSNKYVFNGTLFANITTPNKEIASTLFAALRT